MRKLAVIFLLATLSIIARAQQKKIDSLLAEMDHTNDKTKLNSLLSQLLVIHQADFALLEKGKQQLVKAEAENSPAKQERALLLICIADFTLHDTPGLLNASLKGIRISRQTQDVFFQARFLHQAALAYSNALDFRKSLSYSLMAVSATMKCKDTSGLIINLSNIESDYKEFNNADSALYYAREEWRRLSQYHDPLKFSLRRAVISDMAEALTVAGRLDSALKYYREAYYIQKQQNLHETDDSYMLNNLARTFLALSKPDSARKYALESYGLASETKMWEFRADAAGLLAKLYEGNDDKKSLFYLRAQMAAKDSLSGGEKSRQFQLIADREHEQEAELTAAQERYRTRVNMVIVIGAAAVFLIIGIILWRNNRRQRQTNLLLSQQKEEIETQRDNLGQALEDLKNTQAQLVQREKMASLGELTAGIAHEIQNPLNFVNNFSDVNREMLEELKTESAKPKAERDDKLETELINDLIENERKINHHGKRADAIVKGMLQHSRTSSGQKEPTDINQLADEYLKLAYHGLRAKDKDFNAELVTNFDEKLPKVNVIPQDIGRVLLNVINNAFYAVQQKSKTAQANYKPKVEITTVQQNGSVIIAVKDNGNGIPDAIKDKIMQPFFTTKPTGEGTGLGLSLSYDIVVKGHGGKIDVQSKENEGFEFIIQVPIQ